MGFRGLDFDSNYGIGNIWTNGKAQRKDDVIANRDAKVDGQKDKDAVNDEATESGTQTDIVNDMIGKIAEVASENLNKFTNLLNSFMSNGGATGNGNSDEIEKSANDSAVTVANISSFDASLNETKNATLKPDQPIKLDDLTANASSKMLSETFIKTNGTLNAENTSITNQVTESSTESSVEKVQQGDNIPSDTSGDVLLDTATQAILTSTASQGLVNVTKHVSVETSEESKIRTSIASVAEESTLTTGFETNATLSTTVNSNRNKSHTDISRSCTCRIPAESRAHASISTAAEEPIVSGLGTNATLETTNHSNRNISHTESLITHVSQNRVRSDATFSRTEKVATRTSTEVPAILLTQSSFSSVTEQTTSPQTGREMNATLSQVVTSDSTFVQVENLSQVPAYVPTEPSVSQVVEQANTILPVPDFIATFNETATSDVILTASKNKKNYVSAELPADVLTQPSALPISEESSLPVLESVTTETKTNSHIKTAKTLHTSAENAVDVSTQLNSPLVVKELTTTRPWLGTNATLGETVTFRATFNHTEKLTTDASTETAELTSEALTKPGGTTVSPVFEQANFSSPKFEVNATLGQITTFDENVSLSRNMKNRTPSEVPTGVPTQASVSLDAEESQSTLVGLETIAMSTEAFSSDETITLMEKVATRAPVEIATNVTSQTSGVSPIVEEASSILPRVVTNATLSEILTPDTFSHNQKDVIPHVSDDVPSDQKTIESFSPDNAEVNTLVGDNQTDSVLSEVFTFDASSSQTEKVSTPLVSVELLPDLTTQKSVSFDGENTIGTLFGPVISVTMNKTIKSQAGSSLNKNLAPHSFAPEPADESTHTSASPFAEGAEVTLSRLETNSKLRETTTSDATVSLTETVTLAASSEVPAIVSTQVGTSKIDEESTSSLLAVATNSTLDKTAKSVATFSPTGNVSHQVSTKTPLGNATKTTVSPFSEESSSTLLNLQTDRTLSKTSASNATVGGNHVSTDLPASVNTQATVSVFAEVENRILSKLETISTKNEVATVGNFTQSEKTTSHVSTEVPVNIPTSQTFVSTVAKEQAISIRADETNTTLRETFTSSASFSKNENATIYGMTDVRATVPTQTSAASVAEKSLTILPSSLERSSTLSENVESFPNMEDVTVQISATRQQDVSKTTSPLLVPDDESSVSLQTAVDTDEKLSETFTPNVAVSQTFEKLPDISIQNIATSFVKESIIKPPSVVASSEAGLKVGNVVPHASTPEMSRLDVNRPVSKRMTTRPQRTDAKTFTQQQPIRTSDSGTTVRPTNENVAQDARVFVFNETEFQLRNSSRVAMDEPKICQTRIPCYQNNLCPYGYACGAYGESFNCFWAQSLFHYPPCWEDKDCAASDYCILNGVGCFPRTNPTLCTEGCETGQECRYDYCVTEYANFYIQNQPFFPTPMQLSNGFPSKVVKSKQTKKKKTKPTKKKEEKKSEEKRNGNVSLEPIAIILIYSLFMSSLFLF